MVYSFAASCVVAVSRPADAMISSGSTINAIRPSPRIVAAEIPGDHAVVFLEALDDDLTLVVDHIDGERRPASGLALDQKENIAVRLDRPHEPPRMPLPRSMIGMSSPRLATTRPVCPMAWIVALDGRSVSRIADRGRTIISPPNSTSMPSSTARVRGRAMVKVVPFTRGGLDRDAPAERLDFAAHDIEPDATPGKGRYFVLRGEARA
jgi:hypothetical protein